MNRPCGHVVVHGGLQPSKSGTENKSKRHKGWEKVLITIPTQTWLTPGRSSPRPRVCPRPRGARRGRRGAGGTGRPRRATPTLRSNNAARPPAAHAGAGPRSPWYPAPSAAGSPRSLRARARPCGEAHHRGAPGGGQPALPGTRATHASEIFYATHGK